jgi:hypothetical protein
MKPIRIGRVRIDAEKRMAAFFVLARGPLAGPHLPAEIDRASVCTRHSTKGAPLYCIASIALNRNNLSAAGYLDRIAPSALVIDRYTDGRSGEGQNSKAFQANCLRAAWRRMRHHRFANPSPRLPKVSTQPDPGHVVRRWARSAKRKANAGHLSLGQLQVMSAVESCRSAALGGHVAL